MSIICVRTHLFFCKQTSLICIILLIFQILLLPLLNNIIIRLEYGNEGIDSQYE